MATISISQLDTATQAKVDDLYEVAVVDENSQTGYASRKLTAAQIATLIAQGVQFSGLSTEAKTIIAAINEAAQNGGTEVEANPTGTPTDTLEKIGIDGTIYEVGGSEPVSKTATGNPINITDAADAPIVSGEVTFEPIQDLHGYDKPWAGGAGKNKLPMTVDGIKAVNTYGTWSGNAYTLNGVTFTIQTDNDGNVAGIKVNGTAAGNTLFYVGDFAVSGSFILSGCPSGGGGVTYRLNYPYDGTNYAFDTGSGATFTSDGNNHPVSIAIFNTYTASDVVFYPMIRLATETDPAFEPYSNICPITGYTDCEIEVTDDDTSPTVTNTYTIDLDGTRYGGTVRPVTGKMLVTHEYAEFDGSNDEDWNKISASRAYMAISLPREINYNASNTLPPLISNIAQSLEQDATYSQYTDARVSASVQFKTQLRFILAGVTDTMTANEFKLWLQSNLLQVCYELATPFTIQLTPEQIRTLEGKNNITTNMTDMSLEYITQDYQPLVDLIERSAGHHYSTQERVVGTWIDGKTLYENVVDFGALPNATTKDLNHGIANVDTIFIVGGYAKNTTSGFVQQLNVPVPSNNQSEMQSQWYFGVTATYIRCFTLADRTAYDECKVILQYTKTTD